MKLTRSTVEDFFADRVADPARLLRVSETTRLRSHVDKLHIAGAVGAFKLAGEDREREVAEASPVALDVGTVGRLVASLGQVVRCVSLNHEALATGEKARREALGILDDAGNAATVIAAAMTVGHVAGASVVEVLLDDEAVVFARRCLQTTTAELRSGEWSFGHGDQLDADVAAGIGP